MCLSGLIGELERLADRFFGADEPEGAVGPGAVDICKLVGELGVRISNLALNAEIGNMATLEADGTDEPGNGSCGSTKRIGVMSGRDGDKPELVAEVKRGKFLSLLDAFSLEFIGLALDLYNARFENGDIVFESCDLLAAKKRANALRRLADDLEDLKNGYDSAEVHALIRAYGARKAGEDGTK